MLLDIDVNMHKSNSTFFIDADISRAELLTRLFSEALVRDGLTQESGSKAPANIILAGVQARFIRELKPYQRYVVISAILTWEGDSLYIATYFLRPGSESRVLGEDKSRLQKPSAIMTDKSVRGSVFAILVSKYVIRRGRVAVDAAKLIQTARLMGQDYEVKNMEATRAAGLEFIGNFMR